MTILIGPGPRLRSPAQSFDCLSISEYQKLVSMEQHFNTQLNENGMVKEELDLVKDDDAVVYKLSGPVLLKQSLVEAKENVERRIKYIEGELYGTYA